MPAKIDLLDAQLVHQPEDVRRVFRHGVTDIRLLGFSPSAQV